MGRSRIDMGKGMAAIRSFLRTKNRPPSITELAIKMSISVSAANTLVREMRAGGLLMDKTLMPVDAKIIFQEDIDKGG